MLRLAIYFAGLLAVLPGSSAFAQNAGDVLNVFGNIVQAAIIEHARTEWSKIPPNEIACIETGLHQQIAALIQNGIAPTDSRLSSIRASCRTTTPASLSPSITSLEIPNLSAQPTFDCTKAKTASARILCLDQRGTKADWDLTSAFWARYSSLPESDRSGLVQSQQAWLDSLPQSCRLSGQQPTFLPVQQQCVLNAFGNRAAGYRSQLRGDALAESTLTPEQHAEIQLALISLGFLNEKADGEFGPNTRAAIKGFQASIGAQQYEFLSETQRKTLLEQARQPSQPAASVARSDTPAPGSQASQPSPPSAPQANQRSETPAARSDPPNLPVAANSKPLPLVPQASQRPEPPSQSLVSQATQPSSGTQGGSNTPYLLETTSRTVNGSPEHVQFGTVASSAEICALLAHPIFGRTSYFEALTINRYFDKLDPDKRLAKWRNEREVNLKVMMTLPIGEIANDNFIDCFQTIKDSDSTRFQIVERAFLSTLDFDGRACLLRGRRECIGHGPVGARSLVALLVLKESHPLFRSLFDAAEQDVQWQMAAPARYQADNPTAKHDVKGFYPGMPIGELVANLSKVSGGKCGKSTICVLADETYLFTFAPHLPDTPLVEMTYRFNSPKPPDMLIEEVTKQFSVTPEFQCVSASYGRCHFDNVLVGRWYLGNENMVTLAFHGCVSCGIERTACAKYGIPCVYELALTSGRFSRLEKEAIQTSIEDKIKTSQPPKF